MKGKESVCFFSIFQWVNPHFTPKTSPFLTVFERLSISITSTPPQTMPIRLLAKDLDLVVHPVPIKPTPTRRQLASQIAFGKCRRYYTYRSKSVALA
jgi:hypothetical protein